MKMTIFKRTIISIFTLLVIALGSTVIKIWPENYFWVERKDARMRTVWVRGDIDSGIFVVLNHGGPGGCGTAESLFEGATANGQFDHKVGFRKLALNYSDTLVTKLQLTEDQKKSVKTILDQNKKALEEKFKAGAQSPVELLANVSRSAEDELKAVLTSEQMDIWRAEENTYYT